MLRSNGDWCWGCMKIIVLQQLQLNKHISVWLRNPGGLTQYDIMAGTQGLTVHGWNTSRSHGAVLCSSCAGLMVWCMVGTPGNAPCTSATLSVATRMMDNSPPILNPQCGMWQWEEPSPNSQQQEWFLIPNSNEGCTSLHKPGQPTSLSQSQLLASTHDL